MTRQLSLLAGVDSSAEATRIELGQGAWVDHEPHWYRTPEPLLDQLTEQVEWRLASRPMYDRIVEVPRLIASFEPGQAPSPLGELAAAMERRYDREFRSIACNLYRDGNDSVAWHADRVATPADCVIAIVSLGQPRPFLLRPIAGGPSRRFVVGDGDLLVMGGTAQATWQHAVPKVRNAGPRLCVMFRPDAAGRHHQLGLEAPSRSGRWPGR